MSRLSHLSLHSIAFSAKLSYSQMRANDKMLSVCSLRPVSALVETVARDCKLVSRSCWVLLRWLDRNQIASLRDCWMDWLDWECRPSWDLDVARWAGLGVAVRASTLDLEYRRVGWLVAVVIVRTCLYLQGWASHNALFGLTGYLRRRWHLDVYFCSTTADLIYFWFHEQVFQIVPSPVESHVDRSFLTSYFYKVQLSAQTERHSKECAPIWLACGLSSLSVSYLPSWLFPKY